MLTALGLLKDVSIVKKVFASEEEVAFRVQRVLLRVLGDARSNTCFCCCCVKQR